MGLETGTYINSLNASNPVGATDPKSQGDDHLRLLKSTIKATFPNIAGAVLPTHTELNYVDGVTSAIQTQLDAKLASASYTAADVLSKLLTVDGASSGLDADLLDGQSSAFYQSSANQNAGTLPDARLSANVPLLDASNVFTGAVQKISGAAPQMAWNETDAAANNRLWYLFANAEQFVGAATNDANSVNSAWLTVDRNGTVVDSIALAATAITLNGVAVSDLAQLSQDVTFTAGNVTVSGTDTTFSIKDTDAASDEKLYWLRNTGGLFEIQTRTDAGGSGQTPVLIDRSGTTVDLLALTATSLSFTGDASSPNTSASEVGFKGLPTATDETPVLADSGKIIQATGNVTIPANGSIPFPVGTVLTVYNTTTGDITIAVTSDTIRLAGTATTGTRTLAQKGVATFLKVASTTWVASGAGLS